MGPLSTGPVVRRYADTSAVWENSELAGGLTLKSASAVKRNVADAARGYAFGLYGAVASATAMDPTAAIPGTAQGGTRSTSASATADVVEVRRAQRRPPKTSPTTGQTRTSMSYLDVRVFNPVNMMPTLLVTKYPVSDFELRS